MVEANQLVTIAYTLKDQNGHVVDQAPHNSPLTYLHGHHAIIPGLEKALEGKSEGDHLTLWLEPDDAYGNWEANLVLKVDRSDLAHIPELAVGLEIEMVSLEDEDDEGTVWEPWMPDEDEDEDQAEADLIAELEELAAAQEAQGTVFDENSDFDGAPELEELTELSEGEDLLEENLDGSLDAALQDPFGRPFDGDSDVDNLLDSDADDDEDFDEDEDEEDEIQVFVVREIDGDVVSLDGNHPLAGQRVFVEVTVLNIEPAPFEVIEESLLEQLRKSEEEDDEDDTKRP